MAVKSMKEKLKNHDAVNARKESKTMTEKDKIVSTPISETESVIIYGSEVIYEEKDKTNAPYSLQNYQGEQFVMCPPFGTSTGIANNSWMNDEDEPYDRFTAMNEWLKLYKDLSSLGLVYIAPTHPKLQDQIYISNGIWVPFNSNGYCLMPNFKVEGRKPNKDLNIPGENSVNEPFMKQLGFKTVHLPEEIDGEPCYFEGSADIKMINCKDPHGIVYVCGTGIRTSENAARWIENWLNTIDTDPNSHHKVISYPQKDEDCYHLDCSCAPLDADHTLLNVVDLDRKVLEEISKYTKVIPCDDVDILKAGLCNVVRAGNFILACSDISLLDSSEELKNDYEIERRKIEFLTEKCCKPLGLDLNIYCMSENYKGGACLSCCVADIRGWAFIKECNWAYAY